MLREIALTIKQGLTVAEWNLGVADLTLEELVRGTVPGSEAKVVRPRVRWLRKPWFVCFQADPCLIEHEGRLYLYYEDVLFGSMKGRLRAGLFDPKDPSRGLGRSMMPLSHHAAYPYVFEHDSAFYCVPDTGEAGFVALFKADSPLGPWTRHSLLFERLAARDSTIFFWEDRWWLFANVCDDASCENSDLHIWHGPDPRGPWTPHELQPVKQDVSSARPAGRPFVVDGILYRPAQDCTVRYGGRIAINRVDSLTPDEFVEEVCCFVEPDPEGPYPAGIHTLTCAGGWVVVDGQFEGMKPDLYKTMSTAWGKAWFKLRPPHKRTGPHVDD